MPPSSPDSSSFQMPHIDTVMTCNAADSTVLTQPYAVATSSDYISCRRSSVSQNAVTPMRDYGSRIQVLVADTSSVSISILVIDFDIMQCHGCHHCTISHFRLVPEAPRWRTQTGLWAADDHCGIKPVILEKKQDSFINRWLTYKLKISYMSPCPHRLLPLQPVGRRICRWLLWSSRCSPAPWWCGGVACGRGGPRWGLPQQQPSGGSLESWTSLSPVTVPRPLWRNLMGGYRGLYWRNVVSPDKIPINTTSQYCTL